MGKKFVFSFHCLKKVNYSGSVANDVVILIQVKGVVRDQRAEVVIDNRISGSPVQEMNDVFGIAMMCLEPEPAVRPTMTEVVKLLEYISL